MKIALTALIASLITSAFAVEPSNDKGNEPSTNAPPRIEISEKLNLPQRLFLNYTERRLEDYLIVPQVELTLRQNRLPHERPWEYQTKQAKEALEVGVQDGFCAYLNARYGFLPDWLQMLLAPYDLIRVSSPLSDKGVPGFTEAKYDKFLFVPDFIRRDPNITILYRPIDRTDFNLRISTEAVDLVGAYKLSSHFKLVGAGNLDDLADKRNPSAYLGLVYHTKREDSKGIEYSRFLVQLGFTSFFSDTKEKRLGVSASLRF